MKVGDKCHTKPLSVCRSLSDTCPGPRGRGSSGVVVDSVVMVPVWGLRWC